MFSLDVVKQAVEKIEVEAPLSIILLGNVPLVPVTKEGLVRDVHRFVEITNLILCEVDALHVFAVYGRQDVALRELIPQLFVRDIVVRVKLSIRVGTVLHEFWLRVSVGHLHGVRTIVEVHVPIDTYIEASWDVSPID